MITAAAGIFGLGSLGAAGLFLLYAAREAGARFVVDNDGISRRAWGRATAVAWRELVRVQEFHATGFKGKGGASGRCVLHDVAGRRLAIPFPWVIDGSRLRALLEPHLGIVREAELRELARHGGRFRPDRAAGFVVLSFMTPMFLICGLAIFDPAGAGGAPQSQDRIYFEVFCLAAAPFLALLGVELISRELAITPDGLTLRSLFLDRSIPFTRVESISVKVQNPEEPVEERAKVRGSDGQKIAFDSGMPDYRAVLSLLRSRSGAKLSGSTANDPEFS